MPKKPTTTKEAMLEGAFRLIREKGHVFLTARNLAAFLGCSTQPVMYQFPNLDTLRDLVYQKADAFHSEYILAGANLLEMGLRYIRFAEVNERQIHRVRPGSDELYRAGFGVHYMVSVAENRHGNPMAASNYLRYVRNRAGICVNINRSHRCLPYPAISSRGFFRV